MTSALFLDIETRSRCDLKASGPYRYAEDPTTQVTLFAYALDDEPVQVWDCLAHPKMPPELRDALNDRGIMRVAHNCGFERPVLKVCLGVDDDPTRWHDTMAQAMTLGLPASLEQLGKVVGLGADEAKDKDGKRLIQRFAKPRKDGSFVEPADAPEDWRRFVEYARQDVDTMRRICERLPCWVYRGEERRVWELDQVINDRGFEVDTELARRAIEVTDAEQHRLAERVAEITDGAVTSATQRDALLRYIESCGVDLSNMQEQTLLAALRDEELPDVVRELVGIRLKASKTSTAKYQAFREAVCSDGRVKGTLVYYGARTGRWASRRPQIQNLPRPSLEQDEIEQAVDAIKDGTLDLITDDVMEACSSTIRSVITALTDGKLVVSDLSNIEGRALAWQAEEQWKVKAFHDFDNGEGHDLYKVTAGQILGKHPNQITKGERTAMGKVPELALGYAGGVGAFQSMASVYGTDMSQYLPTLRETLPADAMTAAEAGWNMRGRLSGIDYATWVASEAVKIAWRDRHPETVAYWSELERAAMNAVKRPGKDFKSRKIVWRCYKHWLLARLPSGRLLVYPFPRVKAVKRGSPYGEEECRNCGGARCSSCDGFGYVQEQEQLQFKTASKGWRTEWTYSGKLAENCLAGDVLVLTERGWVRLDHIRDERVWDGYEWASHDGLICQGNKDTIQVDGVNMTPDHFILTKEGWINASESDGFERAPCRIPDGFAPRGDRAGEGADVALPLRLRQRGSKREVGSEEGPQERDEIVLRLHVQRNPASAAPDSRHDVPSGISGMAVDDRSVQTALAPGIPQLRRAWDLCVRAVAVVRELLGGHGTHLPTWAHYRASEQRGPLLAGELPVGFMEREHEQPARGSVDRHSVGSDDRYGSCPQERYRANDTALSARSSVAGEAFVREAGCKEPVYDLLNCGPRNRFVVWSNSGPLIVHNCTQAIARDVLACGLMRAEREGMRPILSVHDEVICERGSEPELSAILATPPDWAPDLPLASEGYEAKRYRKD